MLKCPRCGTNNAPSNASCIACGAALGGAPPGAYGGYPQGYPGAAPPGAPGGAMPQGGGFGPPGAPQQHGAPQHGAPQQHGAPPGAPGGYAPPGGYPGAGYPGQQPHTPPAYGSPDGGYGHPHHPGAPQSPAGAPGMGQPGMQQPGVQQPGMQHPGQQHSGQGMQNPGTAPTAPGLGGANQGKLAGFLLSYDIEPRGSFWPLRVGSNRIGRKGAAEPLDVAIDHPTVSSNHALLNVEAEGALAQVEDAQSANGTLLHDKSIAGQGRRELRDGDQLRFGAVNVIVKLINPA